MIRPERDWAVDFTVCEMTFAQQTTNGFEIKFSTAAERTLITSSFKVIV